MLKVLEINNSILFNLNFAKNTTLSFFFLFFLIIDLYFLTAAAIAQICNPLGELAIPIGIPIQEAEAEIEIHPVIVEAIVRKCSI